MRITWSCQMEKLQQCLLETGWTNGQSLRLEAFVTPRSPNKCRNLPRDGSQAYAQGFNSEHTWPQAQFDKDVAGWEAEAAEMEQELIDLQTELEQQALLLSEEKKQERLRLIQQKQEEYQQYLGEIFGTGGKAERRNAELTSPLLEKINEALVNVAEREGYDLIMDVAGGNVAYIDENLDITDKLLEELNTMFPE